jgi:hypothetical protein
MGDYTGARTYAMKDIKGYGFNRRTAAFWLSSLRFFGGSIPKDRVEDQAKYLLAVSQGMKIIQSTIPDNFTKNRSA